MPSNAEIITLLKRYAKEQLSGSEYHPEESVFWIAADRLETIKAERDTFEKELRETWDYQDKHIAELLESNDG